jgi:hypothetical protein
MDARDGYETAVSDAHAVLRDTLDTAYTAMRDACQKAWYAYQVQTGMIETPAEPIAQVADNPELSEIALDFTTPHPDDSEQEKGNDNE